MPTGRGEALENPLGLMFVKPRCGRPGDHGAQLVHGDRVPGPYFQVRNGDLLMSRLTLSRWMPWLMVAALLVPVAGPAQSAERVMSANGTSWVSGGVGADSLQRLKALEPQFNLKLVFTLVEGNYLSDVRVTIANGAGKTLVTHAADGPLLLVKLPAGQYQVNADYAGKTQARKVVIREGRLHTEYLRWHGNPQTDFPLPPERAGGDAAK